MSSGVIFICVYIIEEKVEFPTHALRRCPKSGNFETGSGSEKEGSDPEV